MALSTADNMYAYIWWLVPFSQYAIHLQPLTNADATLIITATTNSIVHRFRFTMVGDRQFQFNCCPVNISIVKSKNKMTLATFFASEKDESTADSGFIGSPRKPSCPQTDRLSY